VSPFPPEDNIQSKNGRKFKCKKFLPNPKRHSKQQCKTFSARNFLPNPKDIQSNNVRHSVQETFFQTLRHSKQQCETFSARNYVPNPKTFKATKRDIQCKKLSSKPKDIQSNNARHSVQVISFQTLQHSKQQCEKFSARIWHLLCFGSGEFIQCCCKGNCNS